MVAIELIREMGTAYLTAYHTIELSRLLEANDDIDIAGCKIVKDAMKLIDNKVAAGGNVYDSKDADRESLLKQARERVKIDSSSAVELPELTDVKLLGQYIKSIDRSKIYKMSNIYEDSYMYPLLTILNIYAPEIKILISDKYFGLSAYISRTLYKGGSQRVLNSDIEFVLVDPEGSRVITYNERDAEKESYVYGFGDITFDGLSEKVIVIPKHFGNVKITGGFKNAELWADVKEVAVRNLERHFFKRVPTLKSFLGGEE